MAYKCYRYKGETFNGAQTLQYNEAFPYVVKDIFDKVCTDFSDIVPTSEWIDLAEYTDPGGNIHRGCKKYFYIGESDCRFALVFKEQAKDTGYCVYYTYNVTIQATNITDDSEYAEGWEVYPKQFAFYFDPEFDPQYNSQYWYPQSDAWIITVITDENNRVVGISAPQYWLESQYDNAGHSPCNMFMIDFEKKYAVPGCQLQSSLSGNNKPYGVGRWLANCTPSYDISGRILNPSVRLDIGLPDGEAIKTNAVYNDMFNNSIALDKFTSHKTSVFMNNEWAQYNGDCYDNFAITVEGQLWQPIGASMYIPLLSKEDIIYYAYIPT